MKIIFDVAKTFTFLNPDLYNIELVERKFRGHPDSLADMVAQRFSQLYIKYAWDKLPCLHNERFPNFSADKITLSGASSVYTNGQKIITKPIDALLIGKITPSVGDIRFPVMEIFEKAIIDIFSKALVDSSWKNHIKLTSYAAIQAGSDHHSNFYNPASEEELLKMLSEESVANDTVFVVAYYPLSVVENLVIYLDKLTDSLEYRKMFFQTGTDIKAMVRRVGSDFDITMCVPVLPDRVSGDMKYVSIINSLKDFLRVKVEDALRIWNVDFHKVSVSINTKDTQNKKYYAIWGTALSKGDIGAVGRGNRQQGFISGIRPSTNEAFSGKNPNHFSGVVYQLVAEKISQLIFHRFGLKNTIYIMANNGDKLSTPNSIYVILEKEETGMQQAIRGVIYDILNSISELRKQFVECDIYNKFMGYE